MIISCRGAVFSIQILQPLLKALTLVDDTVRQIHPSVTMDLEEFVTSTPRQRITCTLLYAFRAKFAGRAAFANKLSSRVGITITAGIVPPNSAGFVFHMSKTV